MPCIDTSSRTCKPENARRQRRLRLALAAAGFWAASLGHLRAAETPGFTLEPPRLVKTDWQTEKLRMADLNGDGAQDFLVVNNARNVLEFHFASDEKNGNSPRFEKHEQTLEFPVRDLAVADLNKDGLTDIALAFPDRRVAVRYQRPDGEGFGPDRPLEAEAFGLAALDLDADGHIDLVAFEREETRFFAGAGEQGQGLDPTDAAVLRHATAPASALFFPDLDGNGLRDFLYVDAQRPDHVMVRFQEAPRRWGLEYPVRATGVADLALVPAPDRGDWLLVIGSLAHELRGYRMTKGDAGEGEPDLVGPGCLSFDPAGQAGQETVVVGDFDGDQRQDLAVTTPASARITLFVHDGEGRRQEAESPFLSDIKRLATLPRPDGTDLLVALSGEDQTIGLAVWNPAAGMLGVPDLLDFPHRPLALETVDLDGSGQKDLVFLFREGDDQAAPLRLAIFRDPAGADALGASPDTIELPESLRQEPVHLLGGDLDGDQRADLLVFTSYDPPVLLLQQEPGRFTALPTSEGTKKVLFGALTPDRLSLVRLEPGGRLHLLAARDSFARAFLLNTDGELEMKAQFNGRDPSSRIVAATTLQTAGPEQKPSVVLLDAQTPCLTVYEPEESGAYTLARHQKLEAARGEAMVVFDADADGRDDLLLHRGGPLTLFLSQGAKPELEGFWRLAPEEPDGRYVRATCGHPENATPSPRPPAGDDLLGNLTLALEGDQHVLELYATHAADNQPPGLERVLRFKVYDDESSIGSGRGAGPRPEPREILKGDVDGDGLTDLVLLAHDNIIYYRQVRSSGAGDADAPRDAGP